MRFFSVISNLAHTQYRVVKEVMKAQNFQILTANSEEEEWDICWMDTGVTADILSKMKPYQKINHFPSMSCIARKNNLGRNLIKMNKLFPKDYNFFPQTWLLPLEMNELKNEFVNGKCRTFIVKPEAMSQGRGIFLMRSLDKINPRERYVVQKYIRKPYLLDGLKFDLRIYVLVYGCDPLRIFIYKEGLARLATKPYELPNKENIKNLFMHLTNYAINKNSKNFVFNSNAQYAETGHKRSLSFVWKYLDEHGSNSRSIQRKIRRLIVKTLCAVKPQLSHGYSTCQPSDIENNKCFELLGFDIMLDHKLKPWLIEVNHSPSFSIDTPFDHKVKFELISDTMRILNLNSASRLSYYRKKQLELNSKALGNKTNFGKLSREERDDLKFDAMLLRDRYEAKFCGGFTRIYPDPGYLLYDDFIDAAEKLWVDFYGLSKKIVPNKLEEKKTATKRIEDIYNDKISSCLKRKVKTTATVKYEKMRCKSRTKNSSNTFVVDTKVELARPVTPEINFVREKENLKPININCTKESAGGKIFSQSSIKKPHGKPIVSILHQRPAYIPNSESFQAWVDLSQK